MIDKQLKEIFADTFEVSPEEISEDMTMENSSTWDSLRSITLSYSLEEAFGVEFTDSELISMDSYLAIRRLLQTKGAA